MDKLTIAIASVGLAWLSTRFIEDPIRFRLPRTGRVNKQVVGVLVAGMAVIVAGCFGAMASVASQTSDLPATVAKARAAAPSCFGAASLSTADCARPARMVPAAASLAEDDGSRAECQAPYEGSELRVCSLGKTVAPANKLVVVGDSHVGRMVPAYEAAAKELGWQIDVIGKQACYWTTIDQKLPPKMAASCAAWLTLVDRYLDEHEYDGIVTAHFESAGPPGGAADAAKKAEIDGQVAMWSKRAAAGMPILAMTDVPNFTSEDIACVAEHGLDSHDDCVRTRKDVLPAVDSQVEAAKRVPGAVAVDTSSFYCGRTTCWPLIGGVPVVANRGHLTGTYAGTLGPLLAPKLKAALASATRGA